MVKEEKKTGKKRLIVVRWVGEQNDASRGVLLLMAWPSSVTMRESEAKPCRS